MPNKRRQEFTNRFFSAPLGLLQTIKRRHAPQVSLNTAVKTSLRQLKPIRFLLALQQLASKSNLVNFNNNINRVSKLSKSLTSTICTFKKKTEKSQLFEHPFQNSNWEGNGLVPFLNCSNRCLNDIHETEKHTMI